MSLFSIAHYALRIKRLVGPAILIPCLLMSWAVLTVALAAAEPGSQGRSYWLRRGGTIVGACPGNAAGVPLRAANREGQWIAITAVATCRDTSANYSFELIYV